MRPIIANTIDIFDGLDQSSLKVTANSGDTSVSVYSIAEFAINKILLFGNLGEEGSEIIKTHASTAPTGNTVTLVSALQKSHPKDTPVYILPYDQIEISHADTIDGAKTVLITRNLNPENVALRYEDSTYTSGYYFSRYKETITNTFSTYSDPLPYEGYDSNMVGAIMNAAMVEMGKEFSDKITYETLIRSVNMCLRTIRGKLKRWSNNQEFDYNAGEIKRGETSKALPTTYYDKNSAKSLLSIRIGYSGTELTYKDKREFNEMRESSSLTSVATQPSTGDTSIVLTSTSDLDESGTIDVFYNNERYTITYTANNTSTNTLSGIPSSGTGSITVAFPTSTIVWQNISENGIEYYSVWDGYIYFWGLPSEEQGGKDIFMDFYTDIIEVNSDTDVIPNAKYEMVIYWLKWEITNILERNGKSDLTDGNYLRFISTLTDAIRRESSGQKFKMKPKINGIFYKQDAGDFDRT